MSVVLRHGAVHSNDLGILRDTSYLGSSDGVDVPTTSDRYFSAPIQTYPGCFGLPYQDHNYGAPPPITPPASPPSTSFIEAPVVISDKINRHIEIDEVTIPVVAATEVAKEISVEDDSITRCICDYTHDDGYMICCDKCSVWQHIDCMAVDRNNIPESYYCEICEPRPVDKERAYQLQTKRKELLITDSSATDTDPEEAMNRQMSQQQQQQLPPSKKSKSKKKTKVKVEKPPTSPNKSGEPKQRKARREKKDIKKEKENKDTDKKQKAAIKEAISKKINNKSKLNKKPGLTLVVNENAQDPWDSSYSPWVDKYEEARENHYSADILALVSMKVNGQHVNGTKSKNGKLLVQLCHVTEVSKNRKGLEASETIGEGEPIIEYTGKVMLKQQFDRDNFFKQFNPFVLFYNKYDNLEMCVDATSFGNTARFIRRSCKANAEVRHVIENGEMFFYVYSAKVIPRGSEITIPYDYNYKECTYCVECACLRNNCPVAKYFKKRQNAQNKKEKNSSKTPKSPGKPTAKSPVKSPTKSPVKKNIEFPKTEEIVEKTSNEKIPCETDLVKQPAMLPPTVVTRSCKEQEPEQIKTEPKEAKETEHSCDSNSGMDTWSHSDTEDSNQVLEKGHKMTREERKMEAIMKAFEKLEKREERRKEALARLDHKADHKCHSETLSSNVISDEKIAEQNTEKEVESVQEPEIVAPVKKEIIEEPELEPVAELPVMKKDIKPKKKAKKVASRRKSRISSACSSETSTSVSIDENSNTTSCPSTPLPSTPLAAEIVNSPPSFKFLKTKKHLMSEWLNEKSQDCSTTPLEVSVEDALFVTCLPSPRNSMEHLRRNSQNSVMVGTSKVDNSIGSAKKRWLRQAMWDKPAPESRSNSPVAASVDTSPNQICTTSMPSPGASPPGDFVTPLKKRRMARESCDQQLPIPSTSSLPMDLSVEEGASSNQDGDLEKNLTENDTACTKPFTVPLDSAITEGEKSDDSKHSDSATSLENFNRGMELLVCEINQSLQKCSSRTSSDISDAEQEKISNLEAQFTGTSCNSMDNLSFVNEERTSVNVRSKLLNVSSDNVDTEATCASSSGVDVCDQEVNKEERMDMECGQRNLAEYETDSQRHHIEMTVNEGEAFSEKTTESMEVDSTEDSAQTQMSDDKNQACKKQAVCDSTSSKVEVEMSVNGGFSDSAEVAEPDCGSSASCPSTSKSSPVTKENSVVDSSTDCSVSLGREVGFVSTDQTCSSAADQSAAIARTFTSLSESAAVSTVDQSEDGCHEYLSSSRSEVMSVADQSSDRETNRAETVVDSGQQDIAQSHEQSKESLVESISDVTCNEQLSLSSNDIDENVGSSSDETKSTCLFDVSSSSELRSSVTSDTHQESLTVGSSQPTENMNVSSTGQLCPVDDSMLVSGGMADSSEAAAASTCRLDSDQNSVQEVCSVPPCVTNSSCTTNMSEADTLSAEQNRSVSEECKHQGEPTSSSSSLSSSALEESIQASTSSVSPEPSPLPVPTKKKVSLLEYRKRLKEKHTTSSSISNPIYQSSSSPSSQTSPSLSTSYNSSSSFNNPSSTTSRAQSLHGSSRRLVSLPSLPLFDSSPTKDQSRHQFRSSSDLIKRKSSEVKKREKPLSLSERLKLEFGVDDSEEDHEANEKPLEASNQAIGQHPEMSHQQHGPPRYQQPIYSPQIPSPHIQIVPQVSEHPPLQPHIGQQNPIRARGPSPGLLPHQHHMAAQGGPPPQHTNQPVPPPGILNPVPHAIRNNAPPMMNGPGLTPGGPPVRPGGQIPSLMSLQTFPTINLQSNSGQSPSPQQPNPQQPQNSFTGQHISNIEQGMVVNQQGIMSHEQQQYGQQQHSNILPNQGNVTSGGYPHTPPQQGFTQPPNGTNFNLLQKSPMQIPPYSSPQQQAPPSAQAPSPQTNGPVVHDYNHGFGSVPTMHCSDGGGGHKQQRYSPSPTYHNIHQQGSLQRKSKKKKKNKVYNHQKQTYPDSGGHY